MRRREETRTGRHDQRALGPCPTTRRTRRARIGGGDRLHGGVPTGPGHAGRRGVSWTALIILAVLLAALAPALDSRASAATGSVFWDYNTMGDYVMYADFFTEEGNKGYCVEYEKHGPRGVTYTTWYYTGEASASVARADPHALAWLATKLYPVDPTLNGHSPDNPQKASQLAVWMLQGDCSYSGTTVLGVDAVEDGATRADVSIAATLAREALGYAGKTGPWDRASKVWVSPNSDNQNMLEVLPLGRIAVAKTSARPDVTDKNPSYSLSGATFTIYSDKACTKAVETIETDASGKATSGKLPLGTYWVKEKGASQGYEVDLTAHEVTVEPNKVVTVEVREVPLRYRVPIILRKVDADGTPVAQGAASLAGAVLEVSLYRGSLSAASLPASPWMRWTVTTGEDGSATLDTGVVKQEAALDLGKVALPLGTLVVRELTAPEGYQKLETPLVAHIEPSSGKAVVVGQASWNKVGEVGDEVVRGGLSVTKEDAQTAGAAQGDATLAGALFSISCVGPNPVVVDGRTVSPGEEALRIETDAQGVATTGEGVLPYGDYLVREAEPPKGYLHNEEWSALVEVRGPEVVEVSEGPCKDDVIRGGVVVGKVSRETSAHAPQGGATLSGARIEVVLGSAQAVVVDGATYAQGEVVATLVTDEQGKAQTRADALPYGTYTLREAAPPQGYELNDTWTALLEVRENGAMVDLSGEEDSVDDQVFRSGLKFNKVDAGSMAAVGPCPFLVTSETTGEAHVCVTDENGEFDSERVGHDVRTNVNDAAVSITEDGTASVDEQALDPDAGVWFAGDPSREVPPSDDLALPFDTYLVRELRCSANEGLDLVSFRVFVTRDDHLIDRGTVSDDALPVVGTVLVHEGKREAPPQKVTLTDIVTCQGLVAGREYELTGTLHDRETGDLVAGPASVRFSPRLSDETLEVPIEVDLESLEGRSVVAFEELSCGGEVVARHADLNNEDQTISVTKKEPEEPEKPKEPEKETPVPTGVVPKTGDPLPDAAVPVAIGVSGGGLVATGVAITRRRRPRRTRRIY